MAALRDTAEAPLAACISLHTGLMVVGEIEVKRDDGTVEVLPRATLCRCGESEHKPFCDNQHLHNGFRAPGVKLKIHLSPVRAQLDRPITKLADPRRLD